MAQWVGDFPEWVAPHAGSWPSFEAFRSGELLRWLCPLEATDWVELRDEMWKQSDLPWPSPQEAGWWPKGGPQWDGIAVVPGNGGRRGVLLVEAKSHTAELTSAIDASPESRKLIEKAIDETRRFLRGRSRASWHTAYYQYANRLAWLYYLRVKRGLDAWLLWIYFTGDHFVSDPPQERIFPADEEGWRPALVGMKKALGLREPHPLSAWMREAFVPAIR